jgi:hypothetical protein
MRPIARQPTTFDDNGNLISSGNETAATTQCGNSPLGIKKSHPRMSVAAAAFFESGRGDDAEARGEINAGNPSSRPGAARMDPRF